MKYSFDEKIERKGNRTAKWEEMDFQTAPEIIEAVKKKRKNILIQTPVYYPFAATTSGNNRVD